MQQPQQKTATNTNTQQESKGQTQSAPAAQSTPPSTQSTPAKPVQQQISPADFTNEVLAFREKLNKMRNILGSYLKPEKYGITIDMFINNCVTQVVAEKKLLICDRESLIGAILLAAEFNLQWNTIDQHCLIIPYKNTTLNKFEAKFIFGYKGLVALFYRVEKIKRVFASVAYENDIFEYEEGMYPKCRHVPNLRQDRGAILCSYCIVQYGEGEPIVAVADRSALNKLEQRFGKESYSAYKNGLDVHNTMQMKASIKKIVKLIPAGEGTDIRKAIALDDKMMDGARIREVDGKAELIPEDVIVKKAISEKEQKYAEQFSPEEINQDPEKNKEIAKQEVQPEQTQEAVKHAPDPIKLEKSTTTIKDARPTGKMDSKTDKLFK